MDRERIEQVKAELERYNENHHHPYGVFKGEFHSLTDPAFEAYLINLLMIVDRVDARLRTQRLYQTITATEYAASDEGQYGEAAD